MYCRPLITSIKNYYKNMKETLIMLGILCRNQALLKAKSHLNKKEFLKAQKLYQAVLSAFPENIKAR